MGRATFTLCIPLAELEDIVLAVMFTFAEPDTRTAPPARPASESMNVEFWMLRFEPTLLNGNAQLDHQWNN